MKTKEEQFRELQKSIREHHRKMETAPEYGKKAEESRKAFKEVFGWTEYFKHDD